jgi:hypothetical protein
MSLRHNQAIVASPGHTTAAFRAAMNGDKLPDPVAPPDVGFGLLAFVFQILRSQANRDEGKDVRFVADESFAVNDRVGFEAHAVA